MKRAVKQLPPANNNKRRAAVTTGDVLVKNMRASGLKVKYGNNRYVYVYCFMVDDYRTLSQKNFFRTFSYCFSVSYIN